MLEMIVLRSYCVLLIIGPLNSSDDWWECYRGGIVKSTKYKFDNSLRCSRVLVTEVQALQLTLIFAAARIFNNHSQLRCHMAY